MTQPDETEESICPGCKQPILPDVCGCGSGPDDAEHGPYFYTHPFIPMGCDCYRDNGSALKELDDDFKDGQ